MIRKAQVNDIPKDTLSDLEVLLPSKFKEYITIGENYYELFPTQSILLLDIIGNFVDILEQTKIVKIQKMTALGFSDDEIKRTNLTIQDVLSVDVNKESLKVVLHKILEGVDDVDFQSMTISQMADVFSKLIKVNMESFPESFKNTFFSMMRDTTRLSSDVNMMQVDQEKNA